MTSYFSERICLSEGSPSDLASSFGFTWQEAARVVRAIRVQLGSNGVQWFENITASVDGGLSSSSSDTGSDVEGPAECHTFTLLPNERIKHVCASYDDASVKGVRFTTNMRRMLWIGAYRGLKKRTFTSPEGYYVHLLCGRSEENFGFDDTVCVEFGVLYSKLDADSEARANEDNGGFVEGVKLTASSNGDKFTTARDAPQAIAIGTCTGLQDVEVLSAAEYNRCSTVQDHLTGFDKKTWVVLARGEQIRHVLVFIGADYLVAMKIATNLRMTPWIGPAKAAKRAGKGIRAIKSASRICGFHGTQSHAEMLTSLGLVCMNTDRKQ